MFWIWDENRVDKHKDALAMADQCLLGIKVCPTSTLSCQRVGYGWAKSWEGPQLGQLSPSDFPYHLMSCWGKEGGREDIQTSDFCLPK